MNTPRPILFATLLIYASALQAQGDSADWKFFSTASASAESSVLLPDLLVFYLSNEIKSLPFGHIEVWTKGLSAKEVTTAYNKIGKNDDFTDRVARKLLGHYNPPYARIHKLTDDDVMNIAAWEEFANEANISPRLRVLWEIDCPGKMVRSLSYWAVSQGKIHSADRAGEWTHIAPETNGSALSLLLCPSS